jgi:hypothetical protein
VVAVVVHDGDALRAAPHLIAALCALEFGQRGGKPVEWNTEFQPDRDRSQCVLQVVQTRHGKLQFAFARPTGQTGDRIPHVTTAAAGVRLRRHAADVGIGGKSVGDDPPLHFAQHRRHRAVVDARDDRAVERHAAGEVSERGDERFERSVGLEMFTIDVGDEGNGRRELQERPIALVGLGDHVLPRPSRALLPNALRRPPMTAVGSRPARSSMSATMDVVVVFPCAPAMAMPKRSRISSASISARAITGMCRRRASVSSGLSAGNRRRDHDDVGALDMGGVVTGINAHAKPASRSVMSDRRASDPLTS